MMSVGAGGVQGTACVSLPVPQRAVPVLSVLGPPTGFGVYQLGTGPVAAFDHAAVWEHNASTRDVAINGSWSAVGSQTTNLVAGQVASMYLAPGTSLVLSSEL